MLAAVEACLHSLCPGYPAFRHTPDRLGSGRERMCLPEEPLNQALPGVLAPVVPSFSRQSVAFLQLEQRANRRPFTKVWRFPQNVFVHW